MTGTGTKEDKFAWRPAVVAQILQGQSPSGIRIIKMMNFVFKNDEFCIENDEFWIKNDGLCIENVEFVLFRKFDGDSSQTVRRDL